MCIKRELDRDRERDWNKEGNVGVLPGDEFAGSAESIDKDHKVRVAILLHDDSMHRLRVRIIANAIRMVNLTLIIGWKCTHSIFNTADRLVMIGRPVVEAVGS